MGKIGIGIWLNCQWCGKPYRVKKSRYGSKFCSRSCKGANHITALNKTPEMRELSRKRLAELRQDPAFVEAQSVAAAEALRRVITDMTIPGGKGHPMPIPQRTLLEALGIPEEHSEYTIGTGELTIHFPGLPRSYTVDMVHFGARVVVEVDGHSHLYTTKEDSIRDRALEALGYKVIRVRNDEVIRNLGEVVERINQVIAERAA